MPSVVFRLFKNTFGAYDPSFASGFRLVSFHNVSSVLSDFEYSCLFQSVKKFHFSDPYSRGSQRRLIPFSQQTENISTFRRVGNYIVLRCFFVF